MGQPVHDQTANRASLPRVLVVDNERLAIQGFKRVLRGHAEVVVASTFAEALALLVRGERLDAFVFDINLDPGSGLDLLGFARQHGYANTPAIVVTGASGNDFVNSANALRAELLTKPFPPEQLREFVRRAAPADARTSGDQVPQTMGDCIAQLRNLLDRPFDWRARYAVGQLVVELKARPERFGTRAVIEAAAALGDDATTLYRFARVAERWALAEVESLLSRRMRDGRSLSWRHLVALAGVESDDERERLLARTIDESLSALALERLAVGTSRT